MPGPSLFRHALRLHRRYPDSPLPDDGKPYPDEERHRLRPRPRTGKDPRRWGIDAALVLDRYFDEAETPPSELVDAFCDVHVPIHRNDHIVAAACRADPSRVRLTGRWLVRHSTDRCSVTIGLALLATEWGKTDVPLIQTIGLLSDTFGALAAEALKARQGGVEALLWLARRVGGWGRFYLVDELSRYSNPAVRQWLLRHACDEDIVSGYFAGTVATKAHLHEAITGAEVDDDLVDHTGRLLKIMTICEGMGATLGQYPPAAIVLAAHAGHLSRQAPTASRYIEAAIIADQLTKKAPEESGCTIGQRDDLVRKYLAVLDRQDWCDAIRADLDQGGAHSTWFAGTVSTRLPLRAFR